MGVQPVGGSRSTVQQQQQQFFGILKRTRSRVRGGLVGGKTGEIDYLKRTGSIKYAAEEEADGNFQEGN